MTCVLPHTEQTNNFKGREYSLEVLANINCKDLFMSNDSQLLKRVTHSWFLGFELIYQMQKGF